ncbi:MAG: hypothetical protein ACRCXT_13300 [Paraclostridium sp.]
MKTNVRNTIKDLILTGIKENNINTKYTEYVLKYDNYTRGILINDLMEMIGCSEFDKKVIEPFGFDNITLEDMNNAINDCRQELVLHIGNKISYTEDDKKELLQLAKDISNNTSYDKDITAALNEILNSTDKILDIFENSNNTDDIINGIFDLTMNTDIFKSIMPNITDDEKSKLKDIVKTSIGVEDISNEFKTYKSNNKYENVIDIMNKDIKLSGIINEAIDSAITEESYDIDRVLNFDKAEVLKCRNSIRTMACNSDMIYKYIKSEDRYSYIHANNIKRAITKLADDILEDIFKPRIDHNKEFTVPPMTQPELNNLNQLYNPIINNVNNSNNPTIIGVDAVISNYNNGIYNDINNIHLLTKDLAWLNTIVSETTTIYADVNRERTLKIFNDLSMLKSNLYSYIGQINMSNNIQNGVIINDNIQPQYVDNQQEEVVEADVVKEEVVETSKPKNNRKNNKKGAKIDSNTINKQGASPIGHTLSALEKIKAEA